MYFMNIKTHPFLYIFFVLGFLNTDLHAQCFLKTSIQYNADDKITAQISNTYDTKFNLKERKQNASNLYQSHAFLEYDNQNALLSTAFKKDDKTLRTTTNTSVGKKTQTNSLNENSTETISTTNNISQKTSKDAQGTTIFSESSTFDKGNIILKETRNAQSQIVSRETFTYDNKNNLLTTSTFDALLDLTNLQKNTYISDNQLIKSEFYKNNTLQTTTEYTYLKNKPIRKEIKDAAQQMLFYQTFEYSQNSTTESNFYAGILHSKIITTFDNKNNPVELRVFNEKQNLIQKTINTYICK